MELAWGLGMKVCALSHSILYILYILFGEKNINSIVVVWYVLLYYITGRYAGTYIFE